MVEPGSTTRPDTGPVSTPESGSARERLITSGWELLDGVPIEKLFAGVSSAQVAAHAGVTTGSFFHHFANSGEFADAMVLSLLRQRSDDEELETELTDSLEHIDLLEVIRDALADNWQVRRENGELQAALRSYMHLWAHHRQPLHDASGEFAVIGDVLRRRDIDEEVSAAAAWQSVLDASGRTLLAPFTMEMLAIALTAMFNGLLIRDSIDPGKIPADLYGSLVSALATAITAPRGSTVRLADLSSPLVDDSRLSPQARSGARRRRETRARVTRATSGVFREGWEAISASEVAEMSGVSTQTVLNLFGGVRGVAASTFARHCAGIRSAAARHLPSDPLAALTSSIEALALAAGTDPGAARALLDERLWTTLRRGGDISDMDIRIEVPLALSFIQILDHADLGDLEPIDVATTLVNFTLSHSIGRIGREAETAQLAVRLLPPEALDSLIAASRSSSTAADVGHSDDDAI